VQYRKVMSSATSMHMTAVAAQAGHVRDTMMLGRWWSDQPGWSACPLEPKGDVQFRDVLGRRDRYFSKACSAFTRFAVSAGV
jgi:hypothetical protein